MSRVLIVFASHFGQTRTIAERIAGRLRSRGNEVDVVDARATTRALPPPEDYDAVVLGSRVEIGRHAPDVLAYVRAHRPALAKMPTAFFSVSMAACSGGEDPSGYLNATFEQLDWRPSQRVAFAGALPYRKYGWLMRFVMKRISRAAGHTTDTSRDHEFTDWTAVAAFADKLATAIAVDEARREAHTN